jgi:alkanesulfonate monooxygenase SsuD/methylene tetrahydromethanopterin reductase-like flavin-dependent oxidoreductase (luciferase family)
MANFPIQFGYCLPIFACPGGGLFRTPNYTELDAATTLQLAIAADALGYDSIWVADHLMLGKDEAIFEGWTTLAALAGATRRAKLGIIHQAHFFRHPSVAAKMIATVDHLSGGRFIYFADTGTRPSEHRAYGLHYPDTMEDRMPELLEGLELQLALWQTSPERPLTFDGRFYHVRDAVCTPPPKTQPHPPIWFGEAHPLTFAACARYGQGWNSVPVPKAELRRRLDALESACRTAGRPYEDIEKTLETQILIAPDRAAIRALLRELLALPVPEHVSPAIPKPTDPDFAAFVDGQTDVYPRNLTESFLVGTPEEIKAQLQSYIDMGFTHFMLWFMDAPNQDGMRLFMQQVAPSFQPGQQSS